MWSIPNDKFITDIIQDDLGFFQYSTNDSHAITEAALSYTLGVLLDGVFITSFNLNATSLSTLVSAPKSPINQIMLLG